MEQAEPELGESSPWKGRICKFDRRINLASHWEFVDFRNESSSSKNVSTVRDVNLLRKNVDYKYYYFYWRASRKIMNLIKGKFRGKVLWNASLWQRLLLFDGIEWQIRNATFFRNISVQNCVIKNVDIPRELFVCFYVVEQIGVDEISNFHFVTVSVLKVHRLQGRFESFFDALDVPIYFHINLTF